MFRSRSGKPAVAQLVVRGVGAHASPVYGADRQHTYVAPLPTLPPGLVVTLQPIVLGSPEFFLGAPTVLTTM